MSNAMKWFKDCDEAKKLSFLFLFLSFFLNPEEVVVAEDRCGVESLRLRKELKNSIKCQKHVEGRLK